MNSNLNSLVAQLWWDRFNWLLQKFYLNQENKYKKELICKKLAREYYTFEDFYKNTEKPENEEYLLFIFTIAHFYLLNDGLFTHNERPMKKFLKVVGEDSARIINIFYEIVSTTPIEELSSEKTSEDYARESEYAPDDQKFYLSNEHSLSLNNDFEEDLPEDLARINKILEEDILDLEISETNFWDEMDDAKNQDSEVLDAKNWLLQGMQPLFDWLGKNHPELVPEKLKQKPSTPFVSEVKRN